MNEFPRAWAMGVIDKMQKYFGSRFDNAYPKRQGVTEEQYMEDLILTCCDVLKGITAEQIKHAMELLKKSKFCPVFPEIREWCEDYAKSSYKPKMAALANINAWLVDSSVLITNAEREAYNRVYDEFNQLRWANNYEKQKYHTYETFKEIYLEVVKELVEKGQPQSIWIEPPKVEMKQKYKKVEKPEVKAELTNEQKQDEKRVQELVAGGMSVGAAYMAILKEKRGQNA